MTGKGHNHCPMPHILLATKMELGYEELKYSTLTLHKRVILLDVTITVTLCIIIWGHL